MSPRSYTPCGVPSILLLGAFSLFAAASPASGRAASPREGAEPTIGLALGGGSARGIAHIGILEWLEEHRVPVHRIAGTSMGGLIGGGYASGMSTEDLRNLMRDMDWDNVFLASSPFKYQTFRRKEDARLYPSAIELGLKRGLRLPAGMNAGQEITFALDRIAAPYHGISSFDALPTPFRSVAVDLGSQTQVVLGSGSLGAAMRATMAIPGVFTPVALNDQLLVDGGVLNNVPADVAENMGADVVIAVNVGAATDGVSAPGNLFEVLSQTMDVMMASGVARALQSADVIVTPDLRGLAGTDFRRSDAIADRGYAAAEAMKDLLLPYAVTVEDYEAWRRDRASRVLQLPDRVAEVRVEGLARENDGRVEARLRAELANEPFDPDRIARQAQLLRGTERYALVRYSLQDPSAEPDTAQPHETAADLIFHVEPKDYGPPFLHPSVDLQNLDSDNFALNLRSRLVFLDVPFDDSEVRVDGVIGTRLAASAELFLRLGHSPFFVAPRATAGRENVNAFSAPGDEFRAVYRERSLGLGLDVGLDVGSLSQLRIGYDATDIETRLRVGDPALFEADGINRYWSLRYTFDGQTSPIIPTRGLYLRFGAFHYLGTPDLFTNELEREGPRDYNQAELRASLFHTLPGDHRIFFGGSAGTSFGDDPGYNLFSLGGLLRLGAFNLGEVRGENYALAQGGALVRVLRLPDVFGGNGYIGGWLEVGSAFDPWDELHLEWQASGGLVLETILGPVFLGGSVSLQRGDGRFYVSVGPFLQ